MPPQGSAGGRGLVALSVVLEPVTADPQEVVLEISWRHPVTVVGDRDHVVSVRDVDADRSGLRTFQSEARMGIPETKLALGDTGGAHRCLDVVKTVPYPSAQPLLFVLEGIVALREHDPEAARSAFGKAAAGQPPEDEYSNSDAPDTKALALLGLT